MNNIYVMPRYIVNTKGIYEFINLLWYTYNDRTNDSIYLDFKATKNIELNIMAPLGMVLTKLKSNKNKIVLINVNKSIRNILTKNEFISIDIQLDEEIAQNYIRYKNFNGDENNAFREYILSQLVEIKDSEIIDLLISRIMELFVNIRMHARYKISRNRFGNKEIFSSGFYCKNENYLIFTIANNGLTFSEKIFGCLDFKFDQECDYILWALRKSNSTRAENEGPGGLGLFLLLELIKECRGQLIIVSGRGFYKFNGNNYEEYEAFDFNCSYPGTVITMKIPIDYIHIDNTKFDVKIKLNINDLLREVD